MHFIGWLNDRCRNCAVSTIYSCSALIGLECAKCCTASIRKGSRGAESFAWLIVFVFLPLCCVYYPVSTLPPWLQPVALALPPTYVFEGLRAIVLEGAFVGHLMLAALALNVVYFAAGWVTFAYFLQSARVHGTLVQMGE